MEKLPQSAVADCCFGAEYLARYLFFILKIERQKSAPKLAQIALPFTVFGAAVTNPVNLPVKTA